MFAFILMCVVAVWFISAAPDMIFAFLKFLGAMAILGLVLTLIAGFLAIVGLVNQVLS